MTNDHIRVLITSPLDPKLVERIAAVDPRLSVVYRPDLVGQARFPGDHSNPVNRTEAQKAEWASLLAEAEVLFDIDRPSGADMPRLAPRLRWIQTTSSGVGEWVTRVGLVDSPVIVTNAAGVHAVPLAEFVLLSMLYFAKGMPRVIGEQRRHHWERFATESIRGKVLGVVGLGKVGQEIARQARINGVSVIGTKKSVQGIDPRQLNVDELYPIHRLHDLLAVSDYVALSLPFTAETAGLIGEAEFQAMKPGAVLINVARGRIVDELAMIGALRSGHLAGAALDVTAVEPLPEDSPLWDMANVIVTPHSMSTEIHENERIVEIFCDNLRRYLAGKPLRNVIDKVRGY
jgi:phosphoglycerate dehydrogenase-like enzyme